jgi:hypothetical protein
MRKFVLTHLFFFQFFLVFSQEINSFKCNIVTDSQIFNKYDSLTIYFKLSDETLYVKNETLNAFIFETDTLINSGYLKINKNKKQLIYLPKDDDIHKEIKIFNYTKRNVYKVDKFGFIDGLKCIIIDRNEVGFEINFEYLTPKASHVIYIKKIIFSENLTPLKLTLHYNNNDTFDFFPNTHIRR